MGCFLFIIPDQLTLKTPEASTPFHSQSRSHLDELSQEHLVLSANIKIIRLSWGGQFITLLFQRKRTIGSGGQNCQQDRGN